MLDNVYGSKAATRHLIELGHKRIGLVGAPLNVSVGVDRRQGYVEALKEAGLPVDESLIAIGNFKRGGLQSGKKIAELPDRPTALFPVNNLMTMGTLQAIYEFNLKIPQDVSIIGFDDMPWLSLINPPLTAVRQPVYQIGAEAAEILFDRIEGNLDAPIKTIVLRPELVVRSSTARIQTAS